MEVDVRYNKSVEVEVRVKEMKQIVEEGDVMNGDRFPVRMNERVHGDASVSYKDPD